tara:strand:- start:934 stop:1338 length:405 start_codon:yes stop_codon:yes gene_type:complete
MLEAIITDLLLNSMPAEVINAIDDRVFPGIIPQKCRYPAIRHQSISNPASERTSAATQHTTKRSRYQIDVFAKSYMQASDLAHTIGEQLDGYSATHDQIGISLISTDDIRPGYASASEKHHHIIELTLTWRTLP